MDTYTRQAAVLTAYAESDFKVDAVQGETIGIFQQNPRWWKGDLLNVTHATNLFVDDFTSKQSQHTGRIVSDCWLTQQWNAPNPLIDYAGFIAAKETMNYTRRLPDIPQLMKGIIP